MRWLLVVHGSGARDWRGSLRDLRALQRRMPPDGRVWVALVGPTRRSWALSFELRPDSFHTLAISKIGAQKAGGSLAPDYAGALHAVLAPISPGSVDAVAVSAHASGWVLGPWRGRHPFLTIEQVNAVVLGRYRPALVVFDACMMGTMAGLLPLPHRVRWVVASPGLHPYVSHYGLAAFARSTSASARATAPALRALARRMAAEWHHQAQREDPLRCTLAFDMRRVRALAPLLREQWSSLAFDKRAQLHKKDANLFDLWAAARNVPRLRKALRGAVLAAVPLHPGRRCCAPCRRSQSLAVEARVPHKWQHIYRRNRWARFIRAAARRHPHAPPRPAPPHALVPLPPNAPKAHPTLRSPARD
jgi:hypothetical protein